MKEQVNSLQVQQKITTEIFYLISLFAEGKCTIKVLLKKSPAHSNEKLRLPPLEYGFHSNSKSVNISIPSS